MKVKKLLGIAGLTLAAGALLAACSSKSDSSSSSSKSGKTEIFNKNNAPVRQTVVSTVASKYGAKKILHINLGLYKNKPTWEVAFQKKNGSVGYNLIDFRTGKSLQIILLIFLSLS